MRNISKEFPGVKALDDVSLQVRPGTVHALMGENGAGKSTLMKCLFGIYHPNSGDILLEGREVEIHDSKTALDLGIAMIHQELHPIPYRNVMDNIWLGRYPTRGAMVDEKAMYLKTKALLEDLEINIDPKVMVRTLSVSTVQTIEIAKAISYNAKIIIMDEPTSSLTENEVAHLFKLIRRMRDRGAAIIYISHKMEEILGISDEVTIMRDGRSVGTWPANELTTDLIIKRMVGRDLTHRFPPRENVPADTVMRVENLTSPNPRSFRNVSFDLRRGEILGVGGLMGAQRTEMLEALFGLRAVREGRVIIKGSEVKIEAPRNAMRHGMALLTEERRATGIFPMLNVMENTVMAKLRAYVRRPFFALDNRQRIRDTEDSVRQLRIKTPSVRTLIKDLSGGNQQKVLLARWLLIEPEILILDEPTRGIDVGAKYEIYTIIADLARRGKSIIMVSSEMPELLGMSDRIMVMCEGRLAGILPGAEATQEDVMRLATQFSSKVS
ncbi:MAG: ATP-binding cassette domain-containing protein [Clostridiales bacterium]|nr:ATP-binding cassette domain-containing protein [Clostridiales bacterium]